MLKPNKHNLEAYTTWVFRQPCPFVQSATKSSQMPKDQKPEVAFIGRSNVGKSSIINALTRTKHLAKTSNTPGRTQLLNIFSIGDVLYLVDMPGYGYAKAPKHVIANWQEIIGDYLATRRQLKRLYVLIDSRHGMKPIDHDFCNDLDINAIAYQIILTKTDKINQAQLNACQEQTKEALSHHPAAHRDIISTSSKTSKGLDDLRKAIIIACQKPTKILD